MLNHAILVLARGNIRPHARACRSGTNKKPFLRITRVGQETGHCRLWNKLDGKRRRGPQVADDLHAKYRDWYVIKRRFGQLSQWGVAKQALVPQKKRT
jgi:hypothetical protein